MSVLSRRPLRVACILALLPLRIQGQSVADDPMTPRERVGWVVDGTIGPRSLAVGVIASTWDTGWKIPNEWPRNASGFSQRYVEREADVAISSAIEAGLGGLWGEDPRYHQSVDRGGWARTRHALTTVVLAPREDGHLAVAWGRLGGNVFNNVIENIWLPPSVTTPGQTALRSANGLVGRLIGNMWEEFWPDIRTRLRFRHRARTAQPSPPAS